MTEPNLACPPGVRLYVSDMAHARAVRELWDTEARVPRDLPVEDWPDYGRAWLTAQTVKVDLLLFLHDLWMKTLGEAFQKHFPGHRLLREGELADRGVDDGSIVDAFAWVVGGDNLTDRALFITVLTPRGDVIESSVNLDDAHGVILWADSKLLDSGTPSDAWTSSELGGWVTAPLAVIKSDGVRLDRLSEAASVLASRLSS